MEYKHIQSSHEGNSERKRSSLGATGPAVSGEGPGPAVSSEGPDSLALTAVITTALKCVQ